MDSLGHGEEHKNTTIVDAVEEPETRWMQEKLNLYGLLFDSRRGAHGEQ